MNITSVLQDTPQKERVPSAQLVRRLTEMSES
jgi:hypothetical protein